MSGVTKCSKCGSESITKKDVGLMGWWIGRTRAKAYICDKCGYIELYENR